MSFIREGPAPNLYPEKVDDKSEGKLELATTIEEPVKVQEDPKIVPNHVLSQGAHHREIAPDSIKKSIIE